MRSVRTLVIAAVAMAVMVGLSGPALAAPKAAMGVGYDVSYPQCGGPLPDKPAFGIVGVSDGLPYGQNPCLATQYAWAAAAPQPPAFYMNTANPGSASTRTNWYSQSGPRPCGVAEEAGCAYNYGYNGARQAYEYAASQTSPTAAQSAAWWLDVETANSWSTDYAANRADIQGSIDYLTTQGIVVGIYSTAYQWGQITDGAQLGPGVRNWVAGGLNAKRASALCSSSFSGGKVIYVQYPSGGFDADYPCP